MIRMNAENLFHSPQRQVSLCITSSRLAIAVIPLPFAPLPQRWPQYSGVQNSVGLHVTIFALKKVLDRWLYSIRWRP